MKEARPERSKKAAAPTVITNRKPIRRNRADNKVWVRKASLSVEDQTKRLAELLKNAEELLSSDLLIKKSETEAKDSNEASQITPAQNVRDAHDEIAMLVGMDVDLDAMLPYKYEEDTDFVPTSPLDLLPQQEGIDYSGDDSDFTLVTSSAKDKKNRKDAKEASSLQKRQQHAPHQYQQHQQNQQAQQRTQQTGGRPSKRAPPATTTTTTAPPSKQTAAIPIGPAPPPGAVWGKPNASTSSLLNEVLQEEASAKKVPLFSFHLNPSLKVEAKWKGENSEDSK